MSQQLDRKKALEQLKQIPYPSQSDLNDDINYFKKNELTKNDLENYIKRPEIKHNNYKSELFFYNFLNSFPKKYYINAIRNRYVSKLKNMAKKIYGGNMNLLLLIIMSK